MYVKPASDNPGIRQPGGETEAQAGWWISGARPLEGCKGAIPGGRGAGQAEREVFLCRSQDPFSARETEAQIDQRPRVKGASQGIRGGAGSQGYESRVPGTQAFLSGSYSFVVSEWLY